jgi:molybdopterin converting factor small subunit
MKVHLWGELGFYGPGKQGRFEVRLERTLALADALRLIGVPEAEIAVFGLNGEVVRPGDPAITVRDADRLDLFPPSSGGCAPASTPA